MGRIWSSGTATWRTAVLNVTTTEPK